MKCSSSTILTTHFATKCAYVFNCMSNAQLFATLWAVAHQAAPSMGILQARILEWVATITSRGSSQPRDQTHISYVSCTGRQILYHSQQTVAILREMGIPDHFTCLLRSLYAGEEATVRTGHGTVDWLKTRKEIRQGCILSPYLLNFYA